MKIKKIALVFMTNLLICFVIIACSKGFSIEGDWDVIDDKGNAGAINFKDNGTFIMSSGAFEIGGSYSLEDENITLNYAKEDPKSYEIEIEDDESIKLYSIDEDGNRTDEEVVNLTKQD